MSYLFPGIGQSKKQLTSVTEYVYLFPGIGHIIIQLASTGEYVIMSYRFPGIGRGKQLPSVHGVREYVLLVPMYMSEY